MAIERTQMVALAMGGEIRKPVNVLVVGHPAGVDPLSDWCNLKARIDYVENLEEASRALQRKSFDLVVGNGPGAAGLQETAWGSWVSILIGGMNQGLCLIGPSGHITWASAETWRLPEKVRKEIVSSCAKQLDAAQVGPSPKPIMPAIRKFSIDVPDGGRYEITIIPLLDAHRSSFQFAAVVLDVSILQHRRRKMEAIEQAGRDMISLDAEQLSRLDPQNRLALLEQQILRCTRDLLHFDTFEIRVLDRGTGRLELVLAAGLPQDEVELYASEHGSGICGYVAATARSYICADTMTDSHYLQGLKGARSSLTVPLRLQDHVVGVANFESAKPGAFTEEDRQFAEMFGRHVAQALHILELLVSERHRAAGGVGHDVTAEVSAPLNDILTEAESLVEDYIGHDDLRLRLRRISEHATRIRDSIRELTTTKAGVVGAHGRKRSRRDPLLEGKKVLVADDEDVIRETVRDVLSGYGCDVTEALDGTQAVELLAHKPFDLIVSDIKMPGMSGYEVFAAAKSADPNVPVILVTGFGYDPNHSVIRARREGLSSVLFKPFKVDQLLTEIRTALQPVAAGS